MGTRPHTVQLYPAGEFEMTMGLCSVPVLYALPSPARAPCHPFVPSRSLLLFHTRACDLACGCGTVIFRVVGPYQ